MSVETTCHIGCLIVHKVAGRYAAGFQRSIEKYIRENGKEWTCSRLKAIWNAALHLKEGRSDLAVKLYQDNSIAYHKQSSLPKGEVGQIVKQFVSATKPSVQRRWAAVLRYYTGLSLPHSSRNQFLKAYHSISDPPKGDYLKIRRKFCKFLAIHTRKWEVKVDWDKCDAKYLRGTSSYYSFIKLPKDIKKQKLPYASMSLSLLSNPWVPDSLDYETVCQEGRKHTYDEIPYKDQFVGEVMDIQEQSCKRRSAFKPTAYLQLAFLPLKYSLKNVTEKYFSKQSCVTHQTDGAWWVLNSLNNGKDVVSVDLSSATDRFPLQLQTDVLRIIGLNEFAEGLEDVVKHPVHMYYHGEDFPLYYNAGQPMGLNGSFDLFNLSNALLATFAEREVAYAAKSRYKDLYGSAMYPEVKDTFRVLGDDIVFNHPQVASYYSNLMEIMGVDVQETKCFQGHLAEFAGFVVLPTNQGTTAFRPYKVPTKDVITNPVEFLHALGIKSKTLSQKWSKRFEDYIHSLPELDLDLTFFDKMNEEPGTASVRGDVTWVLNLCNQLRSFPDVDSKLAPPTIGSDGRPTTNVNRKPLFKERGMFDWYGFTPEAYRKADVSPYVRSGLRGINVMRSMDDNPRFKQWRTNLPDGYFMDWDGMHFKLKTHQENGTIEKSIEFSWPDGQQSVYQSSGWTESTPNRTRPVRPHDEPGMSR